MNYKPDIEKVFKAKFPEWINLISVFTAEAVSAPLIKGVHSQIECRYVSHHTTGDHTIFVGEAVKGYCYGKNSGKLVNFGDCFSQAEAVK